MKAMEVVGRLGRWLIVTVFLVAVGWFASGGFRDPYERLFVAAFSAAFLFGCMTIDAGLARERLRPGPGGVDRAMPALARATVVATMVIGFMDGGRFAWSGAIAPGLRVAAIVAFSLSLAWAMWAVASNPFFSPVVRIQAERGHQLVTGGPYRFVRHPGYAGMLVAVPSLAVGLGSWWALIPALVFVVIVMRRVLIEDGFLENHLDGYASYAGTVRYRLVPGLW
jgi:protein-S-isoprenylcysteine O-methyltransferase Ste14